MQSLHSRSGRSFDKQFSHSHGGQRSQGLKGQRGQEEPVALASALRLKNFKQLVAVAGEDNLALALDMPLPRVKQLQEGVNFTEETTYHLELTLGLQHGYMDQVNPVISDAVIARLKDPLAFRVDDDEEVPPPKVITAPELKVEVKSVSTPQIIEVQSAAGIVKDSEENQMKQQANAPQPTGEESSAEALMRIRRENLHLITDQPGTKSQLARLTGMSPANISHRLHGNKHFDDDTASFFCEKLGLPPNWFDTPHNPDDVPGEVLSLLGQKEGGLASARRIRQAPRKSTSTAIATNLAFSRETGPAVAAPTPATTPVPTLKATPSPMAPSPSPTPAPLPAQAPLAAAPVASAAAPATVQTILAQPGEIGPIAEALIKTLALKSRNGQLSEVTALQLLTNLVAG